MNLRDTLVLFLINAKPGIKSIRTLVRLLDRADFPSRIDASLEKLFKLNFIEATKWYNGNQNQPISFMSTLKGKDYLDKELDSVKLLQFVSEMSDPELLYELTDKYMKNENGLQ